MRNWRGCKDSPYLLDHDQDHDRLRPVGSSNLAEQLSQCPNVRDRKLTLPSSLGIIDAPRGAGCYSRLRSIHEVRTMGQHPRADCCCRLELSKLYQSFMLQSRIYTQLLCAIPQVLSDTSLLALSILLASALHDKWFLK